MRHVLLKPLPGYLPVYLELEEVDKPEEFVWHVTRALLGNDATRRVLQGVRGLPEKIRGWVRETFDEVEFEGTRVKFKESIGQDWRAVARKLIGEMEKADQTIVFILDELPAMLDNMLTTCGESTVAEFMGWFRSVRMQQKDQLRRHRFIVGGSIGIDLILRQLSKTDKLNDFERLYVEPIPDLDARKLMLDLADAMNVQMDDPVLSHMLELIGPPVPYFIHLFFSQLGQLPLARRRPATLAAVDEVYQGRVLGSTCKHYFDHYCDRLKRYGPTGRRAALAMLSAVAQQKRISDSALRDVYQKILKNKASDFGFDQLVANLECDWYLVLDSRTNEYFFMINVIGDWWRRWYRTSRK